MEVSTELGGIPHLKAEQRKKAFFNRIYEMQFLEVAIIYGLNFKLKIRLTITAKQSSIHPTLLFISIGHALTSLHVIISINHSPKLSMYQY